jgi:hypothetical protein
MIRMDDGRSALFLGCHTVYLVVVAIGNDLSADHRTLSHKR